MRHKFFTVCCFILCIFAFAKHARAYCEPCTLCVPLVTKTSNQEWAKTVPDITGYVDKEIDQQENWLQNVFFKNYVLAAMNKMTDQFIFVANQQVFTIGKFFDAKHQLETQRLFGRLEAKAHKDYQPSVGMCEFGSAIKSLAASESKADINGLLLNKYNIDRQLGAPGSVARAGGDKDKDARSEIFEETFCNNGDYGGKLGCDVPDANLDKVNKDINYTRTIDSPWTIEADFSNSSIEGEEKELLALMKNLYAYDVFRRFGKDALAYDDEANSLNPEQKDYMNIRALIAKRNVAQQSFNAIAGMKSSGSAGSAAFLTAILKELGIDDSKGEISEMLGDEPSYYAQMEVLTKKIYQNPDFYTNLYDKPANVERKGVALQAIGLMQKFDMFESHLRNEASLSLLLELSVGDLQSTIEGGVANVENNSSF